MQVKIYFKGSEVIKRFKDSASRAQKKLDSQVLKDSNYYCPERTGTLMKSGIIHTVIGSGKIIWKTPYARDQYYYFPYKSKQKNPNACNKWFEAAKAKRLEVWRKLVDDEYNQNSK